ncbi:MAG: MFS transporter AraJ [Tannerellaceae bacterium]|nr:MFS transporter AraJ [Tannerellaceae bacterium]
MKKSLLPLAFGTLALGVAEFVIMGILPDIAQGLNISIAKAGHLISAYALGVCIGAPMLVLVRKQPLKRVLLILAAIMAVGNVGASLAPDYWTMLFARLVSGLPHGAYFGVASIVAEKLADKGKGAQAVSIMISGMTFANLIGVPAGTALSLYVSWRSTFLLAACWAFITYVFISRWVPQVDPMPDNGFKGQFRFLKTLAPWMILTATMLGNGGVFCCYSYINPLLTQVAGFSSSRITYLMILAGLGMVIGNLVGGRMSDRFTPGRVAASAQGMICLVLTGMFFFATNPFLAVLCMCLCTTGLFAVSTPQQVLIIRYAKGGELLGAACVQVAFNLGNALGAYVGGLPLEAGKGYQYPALLGVPFAFFGFLVLLAFSYKFERK